MTRVTFLLSSYLLVSSSCLLAADNAARTADNATLAVVNGENLTVADMENLRPASLFAARVNYFEAERKVVDAFIDEYLLDRQAKLEHLTVTGLLDKYVGSKLAADPSEEALRVYYEGLDTTEPYETVRGQILDAIRQKRLTKAKTEYVQSLRKAAAVEIVTVTPRAPISMENTPVRGPKNAPVTVVEYADYECPYCQQVQPTVKRLEEEFRDTVAFAFKDYPLNAHPHAQKAAEAARCAEAQSRFWDFHNIVFASKQVDVDSLKQQARDLGLNGPAFDQCLDKGEKAALVSESSAEAQALGLQGTPTFFVNGRYVSGALTYEQIRDMIEQELGAAGIRAASAAPAAQAERASSMNQ